MAIIPLKQTVTIIRPQGVDDYGRPIAPIRIPLKCRFEEGSKLIKRFSSGTGANQTMSEEVVSNALITLNKFADIQYTDTIEHVNELGKTTLYSPLKIELLRDIAGKPILTEVYV